MNDNWVVDRDLVFFAEHFPFCDDIRRKTFLITGATGLLGSIFIKCLLKLNELKGTEVSIVAVVRSREKARDIFGDIPVIWICQDLQEALAFVRVSVDYIIHCASPTSSKFYVDHPVETINTAFLGTNNLLSYACTHKVESFVYLSSLESYGTVTDEVEIKEEDSGYINPLDVRSGYPLGKRIVECLCHSYAKEYGIPVKIARLTQTFGAGVALDDTRVFAQFAKSIIQGKNIIMHTLGESSKPYCYTIDAILAVFYLLLRGEDGKAYNVANPDTYTSIRNMAEMLSRTFNSQSKVVMDLKSDMGYAPVTRLRLNVDKLEALGWKPCFSLKEMFDRLLEYYKIEL
ncbi:NAD-dependent epimerase/dehydratase family protein [Phocaeicola sp.]